MENLVVENCVLKIYIIFRGIIIILCEWRWLYIYVEKISVIIYCFFIVFNFYLYFSFDCFVMWISLVCNYWWIGISNIIFYVVYGNNIVVLCVVKFWVKYCEDCVFICFVLGWCDGCYLRGYFGFVSKVVVKDRVEIV